MIRPFLIGFLSLRGLLTLVGMGLIAAFIWFVGPFLVLAGEAPLGPPQNRLIAIAGLLTILLTISVLRYVLARRANARMIKSLLDATALTPLPADQDPTEVDLIRERFDRSMKTLAEMTFDGRRGSDFVMDLPWYIIIGPPGAGKTTILRNSGLEFPLAERMGIDPVVGVGGTRNCEWWFTDRAVLIDTAGRYTTQDSGPEIDRAAWLGFLELLRTHRRRRPINGVILAISLAEIITLSEADRKKHVEALRKRLQEIGEVFGLEVPTYVVITKCDLIAGFSEYFEALPEKDRGQVWGMTFEEEAAKSRLLETFNGHFRDLTIRLEQRLLPRLHDERHAGRRARMFLFPKELASIRSTIGNFVYHVFRPSRFEVQTKLRGVYFTSATQEGRPLDRLLGSLGRSFGLSITHQAPHIGQARPFFVGRLLTDVIFEEQNLIGTNRKLERRLAGVQVAGYVAAALATASMCMLWWGAYSRSSARIEATAQVATSLERDLAAVQPPMTYEKLLPVLNTARAVRDATGQGDFFAWLDGLGLSATPVLAPAADAAYDRVLLATLHPTLVSRVASRLEETYRSLRGNDTQALRNLLRTYLMFGDDARFDRATVQSAARAEVQLAFPLDRERWAAMNAHSDRLVEILPKAVALDQRLIALARSQLTRTPRVDQIYERLLREAALNPRLRPINLATIAGSASLEIGTARVGEARSVIPGIFTRDGFYDHALVRLPVLIREELGADWVAGDRAGDGLFQKLAAELAERYQRDYIRAWQQGFAAIAAVPFEDLQRGLVVMQGLADPASPLEKLIQTLRDNVTLPPPGDQAAQQGQQAGAQAAAAAPGGVTALVASAVGGVTGQAANAAVTAALGDIPWPGTKIAEPFKALVALVEAGQGAQPPAAKIRELIGGVYTTLSGIANAPDPKQAAYQVVARRVKEPATDVFGQLRTDAALRPDPVRGVMRSLANSAWSAIVGLSVEYVNDAWKREVLPSCEGSLFNRYPLQPDSKEDVSLRDFGDFFRPGGAIDEFHKKYLAPLVVDQRNGIAAARIDGVGIPFRPDALAQFQRARVIRSAFFIGNGSAPAAKFSIRPGLLTPQLFRAILSIDGKDIVYRHEAPRSYDIDWPTRTDASTVSVTLVSTSGEETKVERQGPWALFRLVDESNLAGRGADDSFAFTVGKQDGAKITYLLKAASVNNPFSFRAVRGFRCPDTL